MACMALLDEAALRRAGCCCGVEDFALLWLASDIANYHGQILKAHTKYEKIRA
jgi:hypothetical protein